MRMIKHSAALILTGGFALACSVATGSEDDLMATGGSGTGLPASGGAPGATGGAPAGATGGALGATGGAPAGATGGAPAGATGGSPPVSTATPCGAGTVAASATPAVLGWEVQTGSGSTESQETAAGPVTLAADPAGSSDPYVAAVLSTWAATSRECVDVSAFTGVQFTATGTASDLYFKIAISATDPSGHCAPATDCYGHPSATVSPGSNVQVPFSSLMAATWGNMAPFDAKQVISLVWATSDKNANITISDVSFY